MKYLRNKYLIILGAIGFILITTFLVPLFDKRQNLLKKYQLNGKSTEEMVLYLESLTNEQDDLYAVITGTELLIGDNYNTFSFDVDRFYLSFAPFINTTHPCQTHNLVTCRGEMINETFHVVVKDNSGIVVLEGDYTSYENGFVGLFLPKNIEGTITVTYQGLSATSTIATFSDSDTCLTTLNLQ